MLLNDIRRTSHFRMAAYFLTVFALSSVTLLGYVYWQTSYYLRAEVDGNLRDNVQRWSQLPPDTLLREVNGRQRRDLQRRQPAVLMGVDGVPVAGAFALPGPIPRFDTPFDIEQVHPDGGHTPLRVLARVLDSGLVLVVGQNVHELEEFDERIRRAIVGGLFIVIVLGLAGAFALGHSAHRRLDAVTQSLRRIVEGDLTERLASRNRRDDLDRIAGLVNTMLDDIERLMREVKGVTDDIAHDLRTPLTRILAGLDRALAGQPSREELLALVERTADDARSLMRMFKGLLRISEIENSARRAHFATVDLAMVGRDAVELFEPMAQEQGVTLRIDGDLGAVPVQGDADLLFDAVANLIDNAIKFTPAGGEVAVRLLSRASPGIRITDSGPGIPPGERDAVLRRFYRSERSRHAPGHGLGLSLVAAIARLHGMALRIEDAHPGCQVTLVIDAGRPSLHGS